jgi:two-component system chemotaxis response regulator CheY
MRLLIVDDSRVSRMMIKAIVKEALPDSDICEAGNSEEAITQLAEVGQIDMAIVDFNMPGLNDLELYKQIQDKIPRKALLTANIQPHIREEAEAMGIAFFNKPIDENVIRPFVLAG